MTGDVPHCPAHFEGLLFMSSSCSMRKSVLEFIGVLSFPRHVLLRETPKSDAYHKLVLCNICAVIGQVPFCVCAWYETIF